MGVGKAEKFPHPVPFVWNITLHKSPIGCLLVLPVLIHMAIIISPKKHLWRANVFLFRMFIADQSSLPHVGRHYVAQWLKCWSVSPSSLYDPVGRDFTFVFPASHTFITVLLHMEEAPKMLVCAWHCVPLHHARFFSLGGHAQNTLPTKWIVSIPLVRTWCIHSLFQAGSYNPRIWKWTWLCLLTRWAVI